MLKVKIMTNSNMSEIITDVNATPQQILDEKGIALSGHTVSLNGRPLSYDDYDRTFDALNCAEGSTVLLSAIVKADSAYSVF